MNIKRVFIKAAAGVIAAGIIAFGAAPLCGNFSVTAYAEQSSLLGRPENVKAEMYPDGTVYVLWDSMESADGYEVYMSGTKNGSYKKAASAASRIYDRKSVKGLDTGKEYWFKVRAYKKAGGKKFYGAFCEPVKAAPDLALRLKDKAPLYSGFLEEIRTSPIYLSCDYWYKDGDKVNFTLALYQNGDSYVGFTVGDEGDISVIKGNKYYVLYPGYKAGTVAKLDKYYIDRLSDLNAYGNYFHYDYGWDNAKSKSGTKAYNGKKYLYNELKNDEITMTFYADTKTKAMKYIVMNGSENITFEIKELNREPDKKLLNIPKNYDIADISAFY